MPKSLYICYFSVREPLVQTQVIPYLREIMHARGTATDDGGDAKIAISLLTFEPTELGKNEEAAIRAKLKEAGVSWSWLRYHKRPSAPATAWDTLMGTLFVWRFIRRERPEILHGRIHLPTLMAALARKFSRHKPKLLFDIRGFFPEEYTDAGVWPDGGWLYRSAKWVERWLLKEADGFVVLTEKAREILFPGSEETGLDKIGRPVEVIPCCIDPARFDGGARRSAVRERLGIGGRFTLVYIGSFDGWYLSEELFDLFELAKKTYPDTFALVLTQRGADAVRQRLAARGFSDADMYVGSVVPAEVPEYLSAGDAAVSFIKNCYSKQASSPTKIAEYLAAGLPVISNSGIGDLDELITGEGAGCLIRSSSDDEYRHALDTVRAAGDVRARCRQIADRRFDLGRIGGERYRRLYRRLLERAGRSADPSGDP